MHHPNLKILALAVALGIAGQALATPMDIDLPRQPLATSLRQLAQVAQLTLAVDSSIVPERLAPAVQGHMEPLGALSQLLQGSGLEYRQQGNTLVIQRSDDNAVQLGATDITSRALGEVSEGTHAYTTGSMRSATKLQLSARETPQSVSVITRQRMDDQNIQSLDDVARTATGISYTKIGTDRSTYYARGFEINDLQFDGIPSNISENYSMDVMSTANMAIYDRVEVVRGANVIVVAGGVGANKRLRARLQQMAERLGGRACFPRPALCTDNGAMIAFAGALRLQAGQYSPPKVGVTPRWDMATLPAV